MTITRTLARATRRKLAEVVDLPPAVAEHVERVFESHLEIASALAALWPVSSAESNILAQLGYIPIAPPLSAEEWGTLAEMMADGRLPRIYSFAGMTRALLERMKDKP